MKQKQLKVSLPDELRARLDAASAKSGRSVAEEIRSRVEASFAQEVVDKPTRDLLEGLALMPAEIEREVGSTWSKHAFAYEVFTLAIRKRLEVLKPEGPTILGDRPHATTFDDDPDELASRIEYRLRRQPDFTNSATRQLLEDEHRAKLYRLGVAQVAQSGKRVPPSILGGAKKKRGK